MKKLVVLSGAGISAESGLKTFRDSNGLWEGHNVHDVASPYGWERNPILVLDFYNQRRAQLLQVKPNEAHTTLAKLEEHFDMHIITQNVDDLHERAGSTKVLHLHGELFKVRSTINPSYIKEWKQDLNLGDMDHEGHQLRPHIVWFGEDVPAMTEATYLALKADIFLVIGTSLVVYPAANLIHQVEHRIPKFIIDPIKPVVQMPFNTTFIEALATDGMREFYNMLMENNS